jgi:glycosyltransferase involved in cell wall biosynthesis
MFQPLQAKIMKKGKKIFAIFVAYNAEKTLEKFYKRFPKKLFDKTILVDDASSDRTFAIAKKLGILSYRNRRNLGYGGNLKRALNIGLRLGGDVFVDIHPDGEYKPSAIPLALKKINQGALLVLGNRFFKSDKPLKSGMYIWKYIPIRILNSFDSLFLNLKIKDFHQGFRVYTRKLLNTVNFRANSPGFLFSFEIIAQAAFAKLPVAQVPVETYYTGRKRGATLKKSIIYTIGTFKTLFQFFMAKAGVPQEIFKLGPLF